MAAVPPALARIDVPVPVPSLQAVTVQDVITDIPGAGLTYRFRFVAPHVRLGADHERDAQDLQHLCDTHVLSRLSGIGPQPGQIVVSLAERSVPFGELSPDVVQFFEAYTVGDDRCVWEPF